MSRRLRKRWCWCLALALAAGCHAPVRENVDAFLCDLAAQPLDVSTPASRDIVPPDQKMSATQTRLDAPAADSGHADKPDADIRVIPLKELSTQSQQSDKGQLLAPKTGPSLFQQRHRMPSGLPGGGLTVPELRANATEAEKKAYVQKYYPKLPSLPPLPRPQPGPFGHPLTLPELQRLAMSNSPTLRQAAADVETALGAARQAGAYPNPMFGYEADNINSAGTAGFQGAFLEQIIKTAGKLKTAEASALQSVLNAQLARRKAQTDLMAQVRGNYFAVLVALRNLQLNQDLAEFTERLYLVSVDQVLGGTRARYEPLQLRAFTNQSRAQVLASRNRYLAAWKQLAASLGRYDLPLTDVAGFADMPAPTFNPEEALARVLREHTDIQTARSTLRKARYDLHAAEIAPIPDIDFRAAVQKDFTTPPFNVTTNVQLGIQLPIWDQNKGAIRQAQGALLRAVEEEHRAQSDLANRVADAFERYRTNRELVERYRDQILPDLARVYSGAVERLNLPAAGPAQLDVTLNSLDFITHLQIYLSAIPTYTTALTAQWQAVTDLSSLLQIDDLYLGLDSPPESHPDPEHPPGLPCSHPCNPLAGAEPCSEDPR